MGINKDHIEGEVSHLYRRLLKNFDNRTGTIVNSKIVDGIEIGMLSVVDEALKELEDLYNDQEDN